MTGSPSSSTVPPLGASSPAIAFSSVVLPQPEGPTMHTSSPCFAVNEMSRSVSKSPYDFCRPSTRNIAVVEGVWSGTFGLLQAAIPPEHEVLGDLEQHRECDADESEQDDAAPHLGDLEVLLEEGDAVAEAR